MSRLNAFKVQYSGSSDEVVRKIVRVLEEIGGRIENLELNGGGGGGSTPYQIIVVESTNVFYVGKALPGTLTSTSEWQIKKIDLSTSEIEVTYAQGSTDFAYVWDDYLTYLYS